MQTSDRVENLMLRRSTPALRLSFVTLALAIAAMTGCGGRSGRAPVSSSPSPPARAESFCRIEDRWTHGELSTPSGAFEFVAVSEGDAEAQIDRVDGRLRIQAVVRRDGWTFRGLVEPDGRALRVRTATPIQEGVIASAGTSIAIVDARAGAVAIAPSRSALGADDGVHFVAQVTGWVPCETVGFGFDYHNQNTQRAQRAAIGLPQDPAPRVLAPGTRTSLSTSPGGSAFAQLGSSERMVWLHALEEHLPYTRVLLHHESGTMILGWVPSEALSDPPSDATGGLDTILGALMGGPSTIRVCASSERLELFASRANEAAENVGTIEPGTRFAVDETHADGLITISPHFDGVRQVVRHVGDDVFWTTRTSAPLECADQTYGAGQAVSRPAGVL